MTAETATVLPVLVLVAVGLVWLLSVGGAHLRALDAAREAARSAARGDPVSQAVALGRQVAPPGAQVSVRVGAKTVVTVVRVPLAGPGGIFADVFPVVVTARAVAARERAG